eukprot:TRINITY_DN487_c0_g2_i1.p1 TRINITY_DN487_c0_g2~~TRINITY_DN487_c0_g2_i1.p1  ORF type:complete len:373 (-),score=114.09 TRINITY_DN487_c0_g2_i1:31-1080(-)
MKVWIAIMCARSAAASRGHRISPTLSPVSDKHFFGKDYPHDGNPNAGHLNFEYPFPKIQKSSTFDEDFVKDENSDDGEWAAQSKYDKLRKELHQQEADVTPARKIAEQVEKQLEDAKKEEAVTRKKHDEAEASEHALQNEEEDAIEGERKADSDATTAKKKVEDASAAVDMPMIDDVEKAKKLLEDRIKHLDGCKEQLAKAQEALKAAVAYNAKHIKDEEAERQTRLEKAKVDHEAAKHALTEAEAVLTDEETKLEGVEKTVDGTVESVNKEEARLAQAEHERDVAEKSYDKEVEDVKQTEKELRKAEENLRSLRHGGHPAETKKSGTSSVAFPVVVTFGAVTLAVFAS